MFGVLNIIGGTQDLPRFFYRVFDLAGNKERGRAGILVVVLGIAKREAEFMVVGTSGRESPDRSGGRGSVSTIHRESVGERPRGRETVGLP